MARMIGIKIDVFGADEVARSYARGNKAIQSKMGLVVKKAAKMLKNKIQEQISAMNAVDTETLYNAIDIRKDAPYTWTVGDLNYEMGTLPYGLFVEKGVLRRHFVPRKWFFMPGKEGSKPQLRIMELDTVREKHGKPEVPGLMIGPMPSRPYQSTARNIAEPQILEFFVSEIQKIMPAFQGNLIFRHF